MNSVYLFKKKLIIYILKKLKNGGE